MLIREKILVGENHNQSPIPGGWFPVHNDRWYQSVGRFSRAPLCCRSSSIEARISTTGVLCLSGQVELVVEQLVMTTKLVSIEQEPIVLIDRQPESIDIHRGGGGGGGDRRRRGFKPETRATRVWRVERIIGSISFEDGEQIILRR